MIDMKNGPSINLRTLVHFRRLILRIFFKISEIGSLKEMTDIQDHIPLLPFQTSTILR